MASRTILALLFAFALSAALFAGVGVSSHGGDPTDFTVTPDNRDPNATDVRYELTAKLTDSFDDSAPHVEPEHIIFEVQGATIDGCAPSGVFDSGSFALRVNHSGPGGYNRSTLTLANQTWEGNAVEFYMDPNDDQHVIHQDDKLELVLQGCAVNPSTADWYQAFVQVDGDTRQGREVGFVDSSHYFGICEGCESDEDAESELGRPPSATPTPTPEPTPEPSTPQPTPTDTPAGTPFPSTPEPTSTDSPTPEPTASATPTSNGGNGGNGGGGGGPSLPSIDLEGLGVSPLVVVGVVAIVSIAIAGLGVRKL